MQKQLHIPLTLIALAVVAGCSTIPQNSTLNMAHSSYNTARSNPEIANQAAVELKAADDSINKADIALKAGESDTVVNHLSYMAYQQVGIAQETAKRKTAEQAVNNASSNRDQIRLDARTAEADKAKLQATIAQDTADRQAAELTAAGVNSERDQALIAQQEQQLKELNAKKTERGMVITLGDVLFRTNKAQLEAGGIRNVEKLAYFLAQYPNYKVLVEGYTDSRGSEDFNQELSDRRANSVRNALTDMQITSDRVTTKGYGEEYPVASNNNASSRHLNRRVEIILSDSSGNIEPR